MRVDPAKLFTCLVLIVAAGAPPTMASSLFLSPNDLTLDLAQCRVEVSTSEDKNPVLRVMRMDGTELSIESAGISLKNNVVTARPGDEQESLSNLVFSFSLRPGQGFQINGTNLDLTVTGPELSTEELENGEGARPLGETPANCSTPRLLNLVGGTAHVIGGGCLKIISTETELTLERTSQTLEIQATGGRFVILRHQGKIILNGQEHFSGSIVDQMGDLELEMSQGQMLVEGGAGAIHCQAENYGLHISEHRGSLDATGTAAAFRIDHSDIDPIKVTGIGSIGDFSNGRGQIRATLEGGRLTVADWAGRIDLQSSGDTTIEIEGLDGDLAFSITEAAGEISDVTGHTRGTLTDSEINFSRLKSIEITAGASQISVEDVPQLIQMNILGGHLNLENSEIAGTPKIQLSDEATADIEIPQPCIVRFSGPGSKDSGNMSVSGCEVRAPKQPWGKRHRNAEKPIQFEVEMREGSEVFVSGY